MLLYTIVIKVATNSLPQAKFSIFNCHVFLILIKEARCVLHTHGDKYL
jgi:hypothetical protein